MNKRFHMLTTNARRGSSQCNIRVDIGNYSNFLDWWRLNGFVDGRCKIYPFTWTYVHDRSTEHPGAFRLVKISASYAFVYLDFCLTDAAMDITYELSDFERVFFGGALNPSRPHFGMCVTIDVK